jgi:hypothetical protein
MPLKSVDKTKIESIDYNENTDIKENYITEKYLLLVEGYSLSSNIGFVKTEIGYGISLNDAFFRALDKIGLDLFVNYNISINHMWTKDCRLYDSRDTIQSSGYGFYTLTDELIQQFKEEGERYCMSREDK